VDLRPWGRQIIACDVLAMGGTGVPPFTGAYAHDPPSFKDHTAKKLTIALG